MTIALMSAMQEECSSLIEQMIDVEEIVIAGRIFYKGKLWEKDVVLVFSRWGKVAAASTTVVLIREFKVSEIIFTGIAGAIDSDLNVGDVVIGKHIYQHDIDARPILARYEIPLLGIVAIETDTNRRPVVYDAACRFVDTQLTSILSKECIRGFNITNPKVVVAGIATGDQFISNEQQAMTIRSDLPDVVCVEMEGGAVAQVCNEYNMKFSIVRIILLLIRNS